MTDLEVILEELVAKHGRFRGIPDALQEWLLPIRWDREALWRLELPVSSALVADLDWHLDLPWWREQGEQRFVVTPRQVLADPDAYPYQTQRIANAGLGVHPIHIIERHDRLLIMDGIHRLARATAIGARTIDAKLLRASDVRRIVIGA